MYHKKVGERAGERGKIESVFEKEKGKEDSRKMGERERKKESQRERVREIFILTNTKLKNRVSQLCNIVLYILHCPFSLSSSTKSLVRDLQVGL